MIEIRTSQYEFSHGRKPRGEGCWFFAPAKEIRFDRDRPALDYFQTACLPYGEAVKAAREWAKARGFDFLYAQP